MFICLYDSNAPKQGEKKEKNFYIFLSDLLVPAVIC